MAKGKKDNVENLHKVPMERLRRDVEETDWDLPIDGACLVLTYTERGDRKTITHYCSDDSAVMVFALNVALKEALESGKDE